MSDGRLARSARLIGLATLSSRFLGLVRTYLLSRYFGASDQMDAFNVATRIPNMLRDLFAEGAMSASFVPTFSRYLTREGRESAWRLGSQVINALLVITGAIVIIGIVCARLLTTSLAENFEASPGKFELTVSLVRANLPFLTLIAVAAACMGMLNALRRFFIPAFSPAMYNVLIIVSAVTLIPVCEYLGWPSIWAITVGSVLGGAGQIAIQWPALRREGYRHQWRLNFRDPGLREVLLLMGPGTLGVAASQINLLVNMRLASSNTGQVTWLTYAFQLMYLPIGLFGVSVATAALPELTMHAGRGSMEDLRATLSSGLRLMLMLSVPSMAGLVALGVPIVELLQESGKFTHADTLQVAAALTCYAPGLIGYSVVKLASPTFYALRDAHTPAIVSVVTVLSNVVLNVTLMRAMGYLGLAVGTAIAANLNAAALLFLLSRRIGGVDGARVARAFAKIALASAVMALAAYGAEAWVHHALPSRLVGLAIVPRLVRVAAGVGVGIGVLGGAAWVLRIEEFRAAVAKVIGRLKV